MVSSSLVAAAATSIVSLYNIGDAESVGASVISADKTATAYSIECMNTDECGMPVGATVTQGPSTWAYTVVYPQTPAVTLTANCKWDLTSDTGSCTTRVPPGLDGSPPGLRVVVTHGLLQSFSPVTVTAGLEKIAAAATASSSVSKPTGESASSPSSSHNAAPAMTQQAVLAGVAAVAAAFAL